MSMAYRLAICLRSTFILSNIICHEKSFAPRRRHCADDELQEEEIWPFNEMMFSNYLFMADAPLSDDIALIVADRNLFLRL